MNGERGLSLSFAIHPQHLLTPALSQGRVFVSHM